MAKSIECEYRGKSYSSIAELAIAHGIKPLSLNRRIRQGEKLENAVKTLLPIIVYNQKFKTHVAIAKHHGIEAAILRHRVKNLMMSYEEAIELPVKKLKRGPVVLEGITYSSFAAAAKAYGKDPEATRQRVHARITAEEAI